MSTGAVPAPSSLIYRKSRESCPSAVPAVVFPGEPCDWFPKVRLKSRVVKEENMSKKRYQVKAVCPHCACGTVDDMSADELKARTIDGDNLEINCPECMEVHRANIRSACPDYADECHM